MNRNFLAILLTVVSFFFFFPGIFLPIFSLKMSAGLHSQIGHFAAQVIDQEASILRTIEQLFDDGRILVAVMIFIFSIIVPLAKGGLLGVAYFSRDMSRRIKCHKIANAIGKWSMADVFIVAIFLAYLSTHGETKGHEQVLNIMGMQFNIRVDMNVLSDLGAGFYCFLLYCIFSITSFQIFCPEGQRLDHSVRDA